MYTLTNPGEIYLWESSCLECSKFHNFIEDNISLVWSWIEMWIAESCLVTLTVQTSHSYGDIMLLAKASESKQTFDLSNLEAVDFLDTFLSINPNSSGQVRIHDFFRVLRLKACNLSEKIFGVLDVDKKGKISFKQFLIWVSSCPTATIFRRAYELAFAECHTGGNRYISEQELGDSIKPAIPNMDKFEIHELFKSFDTDSDGRINKDDFITCLRRNPLLVALFSPQLMHKNLSGVDDT